MNDNVDAFLLVLPGLANVLNSEDDPSLADLSPKAISAAKSSVTDAKQVLDKSNRLI